jgi:hypothetical protein
MIFANGAPLESVTATVQPRETTIGKIGTLTISRIRKQNATRKLPGLRSNKSVSGTRIDAL